MYITRYKALLGKKKGNGWESGEDRIELDNILSISVDETSENRASSFSILVKIKETLNELGNTYDFIDEIEVEDNIQIYVWYQGDSELEAETLIIDGLVKKTQYSEGQKTLKITGQGRIEYLLRYQIPSSYLSSGAINTAPLIIQNLLDKLRGDFQQENSIQWDTTNNPTTTSLGEAFQSISYTANWKPIYQQISELSASNYTGDSNYSFWIETRNNINYLRWGPKNYTDKGSVKLGEINTLTNADGSLSSSNIPTSSALDHGTFNVLNFLIINAGEDSNGNGIITFVVNTTSMKKHGTKSKYYPLDIATEMFKTERTTNSASWTDSDSRLPDSFPYTTAWKSTKTDSVASPTTTKGQSITLTSADDFITAFRREAKWVAQDRGQDIVDLNGNATYQSEFDLAIGTNALAKNGIYKIESDALDWNIISGTSKNMRLKNIQHEINDSGWATKIKLLEEPTREE